MKNANTNELIIEKARKLFFSYGLKSVSMDDIANEVGISKKAIYEFFDDKNALVDAVVNEIIQSHEKLFESSRSTSKDAIDEVIKQDQGLSSICNGIKPSFFYQLENFFPDVWQALDEYKLKMYKNIIENLARGQNERIYRKDIDEKLIADLRLHQLINLLKPQLLTDLNVRIKQLADEFTLLYLHSIATEKGKELIDKYLNENGFHQP